MAPKSKPISEKEPQLDDPNVASSSSDTAPPPDTSYAPTYAETLDFIWRNAEILCQMISDELEEQEFSRALFAERITNCSEEVLSNVLRNPKSWAKLKTGRNVLYEIYRWMCLQPVNRAIYYRIPEEEYEDQRKRKYNESSCPKLAQNLRDNSFNSMSADQKGILQQYYNREKRPNDALLEFLADCLKLDLSIVTKFFKDARIREGIEEEGDTKEVDTDEVDDEENTDHEEEEEEDIAAPQQSKKWKPKKQKKKKKNNKGKKKNGKYGR